MKYLQTLSPLHKSLGLGVRQYSVIKDVEMQSVMILFDLDHELMACLQHFTIIIMAMCIPLVYYYTKETVIHNNIIISMTW